MSQVYCVIDYETRSEADLKKVGAYEYARHSSTSILCIAWKIGTRETLRETPTQWWSPALPWYPLSNLLTAFARPSVTLVAHNAFFEQVITRFVLGRYLEGRDPNFVKGSIPDLPPERWICTASQARALALPGKLADACAALKLPVQKDMEGRRLMLKLSKPRKATKNNKSQWHCKTSDLKRLIEYCRTDVAAETELFLATPELIPSERELWLLDQKINWRGFHVDRPLVNKIRGMIVEEQDRFLADTKAITKGTVNSPDQRNALLEWLRKGDVLLPDLRAKTVADALSTGLAKGKPLRMLQIRADATKTSTAKYEALEARSRSDSRVRDSLVYHAASTGRFAGAGVQPQNLPKGTIGNTDKAAAILLDPATDLDTVRMLYGNPLDVFSSVLRACITATPGRKLFGGDFAGIEVRVLFWIANHLDGLNAFRDGRDLYRELAATIYNKPLDKVTAAERNKLGKPAILGCGFGMGWKKFAATCEVQGNPIEDDLAKAAVGAYRAKHAPVVRVWSNLERAAIAATLNPGKRYSINMTTWYAEGKFLFCKLPSGRRLAYREPQVRSKLTPWGEKKPSLHHMDRVAHQWALNHTYGGKLTENVVQAIARDLMTDATKRAEKKEYEILITAHDELLTDRATGSASEFEKLMSIAPPWAGGLPIKVEAWTGERYRK